jgi:hypothetical protein
MAAALAVGLALIGPTGGQAQRAPMSKSGASLFGLVLQGYSHQIDAPALQQANPDTVRIILPEKLIKIKRAPCTSVGGGCNWTGIDEQIGGAAQAGADPLPFLYGKSAKPPLSGAAAKDWRAFVTAAVQRYGPNGAFWNGPYQALYPGAQPKVVQTWQVWNEPGSPTYWKPRPNPAGYAKLLKASGQAIHAVDPKAKIMLAGLFASSDKGAIRGRMPAVQYLEKLYAVRGAKGLFDIAAIHPYSRDVNGVIAVVQQLRDVMRKHGDARKPLAITELGWSSNSANGSLLAKGTRGQATTLTSAFRRLLAVRSRFRLDTVDWFSLRDAPKGQSSCPNCPYAGLNKVNGRHKPAWKAFTSFTR